MEYLGQPMNFSANLCTHTHLYQHASINRFHIFYMLQSFIRKIDFGLVWLGRVLWHINHCKLFNAKSSLHILNI